MANIFFFSSPIVRGFAPGCQQSDREDAFRQGQSSEAGPSTTAAKEAVATGPTAKEATTATSSK